MGLSARHDAWAAGDHYETFMGRWSRMLARPFLAQFDAPQGLDWLDIGCGTGALSEAVLVLADPASLIGIDPSGDFVEATRRRIDDPRARFMTGSADTIGLPDASRDVICSGLVLNFVPDRAAMFDAVRRVARPGARLGLYVWDYPEGMGFLNAFWDAAAALDPDAAELTEARRFPWCTEADLPPILTDAGFSDVACWPIEIETRFRDFEDFWHPFTLGAGPAPGYCASLPDEARGKLRDRLEATLKTDEDGTIPLSARAWALSARI